MRKIFQLIGLTLSALIVINIASSCSEEENCSLMGRSMVNCILYKINPVDDSVELDTLAKLTVTAFETDSIIINNQTDVRDLSLPLRYTTDKTILVFHYDLEENPELNDTVYITQKNTPFFESMKCGYTMTQVITGVKYTKHLIDSIYIKSPNANINGTENLKIFYRNND